MGRANLRSSNEKVSTITNSIANRVKTIKREKPKLVVKNLKQKIAKAKKPVADVSFRLQDDDGNYKIVKTFKSQLASASPVFSAMFMGTFSESCATIDKPIDVLDIPPSTFETMVKFIKTGAVPNVEDLSDCEWADLCVAAHRYNVQELEQICPLRLQLCLTKDNAVTVFQVAQHMCNETLEKHALIHIKIYFQEYLECPEYLENLSYDTMLAILDDRHTYIKDEVILFTALFRWAQGKCAEEKKVASGPNLRGILGRLLGFVRFVRMTPEQIEQVVRPTKILTKTHFRAISWGTPRPLSNQEASNRAKYWFARHKRFGSHYSSFKHFNWTPVTPEIPKGKTRFFVSSTIPVVLLGFGFFSNVSKSAQVSAKISLTMVSSREKVGEGKMVKTLIKKREMFRVWFDSIVLLKSGEEYNLAYDITGPPIPLVGPRDSRQGRFQSESKCFVLVYRKSSIRIPEVMYRLYESEDAISVAAKKVLEAPRGYAKDKPSLYQMQDNPHPIPNTCKPPRVRWPKGTTTARMTTGGIKREWLDRMNRNKQRQRSGTD